MIGYGCRGRWNAAYSARRALLAAAMVAAGLLAAVPAHAQKTRSFDIALRNGAVTGGKSVRVKQGDDVVLRWTSDQPLELHLHGYDVTVKVAPDAPAEMKIHARATGRFPVAIHGHRGAGGHSHSTLFHLEVHPN